VFRSAHRYEFRYYRLPAAYQAQPADVCDPYDDERARFLESAGK
jgi:hypothetical protein